MVNELIWNILIIFMAISFCAWIVEFLKNNVFPKDKKLINYNLFKIFKKKLVNPGFLRGPYLPIYGFGALLIILISFLEINLFVKLILFFFSNVLVELSSGIILLNYFGIKLWEYDKSSYKGIISIPYSIYFFVASVLFYFYIFPHYYAILYFIKSNFLLYVIIGFYLFFFVDLIVRIKKLIKNKFKK
jgi:uncharacterized membrane protein